MKSSRLTFKISLITSLVCLILLSHIYFCFDLQNPVWMLVKDIILAIFSGSFMTILFSYTQMKIYEKELLAKFQNILIKIIDVCNIEFRDKENYKKNEECDKAYNEFKKVRNDMFLLAIDLREMYYFVNIRTKSEDIVAVQKCIEYIISLLKEIEQYFVNFEKIYGWKEWEKDKLLCFNKILWYEIEYPDSEIKIQTLADETNYLLCGETMVYSRIFYDITKLYPKLMQIYRLDLID